MTIRSDARKEEVAWVIMDAATLIRRRGFCVGALTDDSGRLCLMGAIKQVADSGGYAKRIKYAAYDAVNRTLRRPIHEWNDEQTEPTRVADLLEGIAKRLNQKVTWRSLCWHGRATNTETICSQCTRND